MPILNPDDFKVADLSLHGFGRKEIQLAEHEMPGLMATRAEFADAQPLAGARIMGSLHMTTATFPASSSTIGSPRCQARAPLHGRPAP